MEPSHISAELTVASLLARWPQTIPARIITTVVIKLLNGTQQYHMALCL